MIGILIALQVNNWNNSRTDQLSKRIYLQRLTKDLSADSTQLLSDLFTGRMLSFAHPRVTTATFEELKNTGNFKQIRNSDLRPSINDYYANRQHAYLRIDSKRLEPSYGDVIDQIIPGFDREAWIM